MPPLRYWLKLLAGLEQVTSGRIYLDGRDVTGLPPAAFICPVFFSDWQMFRILPWFSPWPW